MRTLQRIMTVFPRFLKWNPTVQELKYRILAEAQRKGHTINFDVLYYATESGYNAVKDEIGTKEGEYIREYKPALNTQIPKETDYHTFNVCRVQTKEILNNL